MGLAHDSDRSETTERVKAGTSNRLLAFHGLYPERTPDTDQSPLVHHRKDRDPHERDRDRCIQPHPTPASRHKPVASFRESQALDAVGHARLQVAVRGGDQEPAPTMQQRMVSGVGPGSPLRHPRPVRTMLFGQHQPAVTYRPVPSPLGAGVRKDAR